MTKLVSAVITTCNRFALLQKAVKSVQNQSYTHIELIVIDGSANQNAENLYANKENIIYVKSVDSHPNVLRNLGIDCASGELIAFLDDDDEWIQDKIKKQVECFNKNNIDLCYTGKNIISQNREKIKYSYKEPFFSSQVKSIMGDNFIGTTSSVMISKKALLAVNGFDIKLPALQDYDLYIRLCLDYKVIGIDEPLINYHYNHSVAQVSQNLENFRIASTIIKNKFNNLKYSYILKMGLFIIKIKRKIKSI